jgi:hypothetical protein
MIGHRNYGSNYGGSHPGDSLAFFVAIAIIIGLAVAAFASID